MHIEQLNDWKRLAALYRTGRIDTAFLAQSFGMTRRHVRRLLHQKTQPRKRTAWNRITPDIRQFLLAQKKENPAYNCQWLAELASDRFGRSVAQATVWRLLRNEGVLHDTPTTPTLRKRFEAAAAGDLVQMDTTWGYWLGDKRLYLTVLLDDHSRYLLVARWSLQETLWHNMTLIRDTVESYGCFRVLYTDNASWFKAIRHNQSAYQLHRQSEYESAITRSCRALGIVHITHQPYQPQGKGKIERLFRFIQERFVAALDDPDMPLFVINKRFEEWRRWYNTRHVHRTIGCVPKERFDPQRFQPLSPLKRRQLDDIFALHDTRVVDKCNQFSYEGRRYTIPGTRSYAHRTVELHIHPQQNMRVWHENVLLCELPLIT